MAKRSGRIPYHLVKTETMLKAVSCIPQELWHNFFNQFQRHELISIACFMGIEVHKKKITTVEEIIDRIIHNLKMY